MPSVIKCPNPDCRRGLSIPDGASLSRRMRCPHCQTRFSASSDEPVAAGKSTRGPVLENVVERPAAANPGRPQRVGRFEVRQRLGAGAFAAVYQAYDPHLDREVALKVPHPGSLEGPKRVERFLREAKAAANLRHPHIVPLFESGRDGDAYYIVSAFIQGTTLADALGEGDAMKPARAAKVVRALAEALAYAHEQGIVHRDVKPANVMLDANGQPFLMDFGLASRKDNESKLTNEGAVLGTPSYMAPEQASGKSGAAGPAADQYSLGCVLFELLTGQTPFDGTPEAQLFQHVRTEAVSPRKLRPEVPLDLAAVCLKCLEKEPARRYSDCNSLAEDLRRFLASEPTAARPLGLVAWAGRLARRNPLIAALAAGIVVVLAAGVVTSSLYAWRAARGEEQAHVQAELAAANAQKAEEKAKEASDLSLAEKQAKVAAQQAKVAAEQAKVIAETREQEANKQRDKARENFRLARGAVDDMYTRVAEEWLAQQPQLEPIQREFLQKALKFYEGFAQEGGTDPSIRFETATAYRRVADIQYRLGSAADAERSFKQALDRLQKLADEFPEVPAYRQSLGESLRNLAELQSNTARYSIAETNLRRTLALQEKLVSDSPSNAGYRSDLSRSYYLAGRALISLNRLPDAEKYLRLALGIQRALVAEFSSVQKYQLYLAKSSFALSSALYKRQPKESEQAAKEAADILARLVAQHQTVPQYRTELAAFYHRMSQVSPPAEAEPLMRKALALHEKLAADFPSVADYRYDLVNSYQRLGQVTRRAGRYAEAEKALGQASAIIDKLAADSPTVVYYHSKQAEISSSMGILFHEAGRLQEAEEAFRQSVAIYQKLVADFPEAASSARTKRDVSTCMYSLACIQALTVLKSADPVKQGDLAMDTLTKAVRAGFNDPSSIAKDKDLNALRNRADFKGLLAEMQKSKRAKPK
jgi:tetratricopeptide (TPR) repeat protein